MKTYLCQLYRHKILFCGQKIVTLLFSPICHLLQRIDISSITLMLLVQKAFPIRLKQFKGMSFMERRSQLQALRETKRPSVGKLFIISVFLTKGTSSTSAILKNECIAALSLQPLSAKLTIYLGENEARPK
ncbi:hypothetical protein M514_06402 [Trichuris suis]|uniref:Uncharacterized protein n=1 Tax=Trichuris suis TaxID=68888 RepID=A0A085NPY6_9BILA|nr:hypothetical protein M513_06402 [Trichuris suis]KFD71532.1 hypothetical protein M514_06402 [Trichuris suis]